MHYTLTISPKIFPQNLVLLSARLQISDFETSKSISFMQMLSNKGPEIDPCVNSKIISHQSLKLEPIFVLYFRLLN